MECLWRRKDKKKKGERIRRRWVATASATKDINEKEIINVYSSGPFLFFLFCFFFFFFFFVSIVRDEISGENERVISFELYNKWETRFDEEIKINPPPPPTKKENLNIPFLTFFLVIIVLWWWKSDRWWINKERVTGARARATAGRIPRSRKTEYRRDPIDWIDDQRRVPSFNFVCLFCCAGSLVPAPTVPTLNYKSHER